MTELTYADQTDLEGKPKRSNFVDEVVQVCDSEQERGHEHRLTEGPPPRQQQRAHTSPKDDFLEERTLPPYGPFGV